MGRAGGREPASGTGSSVGRSGGRVGLLAGGVLAVLVLGPLLVRGYVLTYDMVFVPRLELGRGLLGLDVAVPRAVPADLLVALAGRLVPGDLVQKLVLAGVFVGAAAGAARLVPSPRPAARAAAAVLYAWNPFVYERLLLGHWGLLVSYAALPWVASSALDLRLGARGAVRRLVLTLAVAAAGSPTGGLLATALALCIAVAPSRSGSGGGDHAGSRPSGSEGGDHAGSLPRGSGGGDSPAHPDPGPGAVDSPARLDPGPGAVDDPARLAPGPGAVDDPAHPDPGLATLPHRGTQQRRVGLERVRRTKGTQQRRVGVERARVGPAQVAPAQVGPGRMAGRGPGTRGTRQRWVGVGPARVGLGLVVAGVGLVVNLPWLVPSVLRPGGVPVRAEGVAAFAARPDGPLGTVGSLAGLGGIWNALVVPPGLGSWPWLAGFAVVLAVAAAGLPLLGRRWPPGAAAGLLVAAGAGLLVAAAPALPGLRELAELAVTGVPGGGLLRDSQKFVAPLALAEAVCFGLGVERVLPALPVRWTRLAAAGLVVAPVLLLPALAWGAAGRLSAVDYPPAFAEARAAMAADPVPGAVLVLPWHLYQPYAWNGDRVVLDPAQRWFTRRAVGNDDLELVGLTVPGEDPYGARLGPLVRGAAPLAPALPGAGVRYVLVFRTGDWRSWSGRLDGLVPTLDRPELALYRVPGQPVEVRFPAPPAAPVVAADLLVLALLTWAVAAPSLPFRPRRLVSSARHRQGGPE